MSRVLALALDMLGAIDDVAAPEGIGQRYFDVLKPMGLKAIYARAYSASGAWLSQEALAANQHVYARISPPGWEDAYARLRLDRANPTIKGALTRVSGFAWSEIDPAMRTKDRWIGWQAIDDFDIADGLAIPVHGPNGYRAVVSLGFEKLEQSPAERRAIELTAVAVHDRLREVAPMPVTSSPAALSVRERDCLCFVADGKSDWEIGAILGISQTTAHSHVENAKRKLGAKTRAQAVARLIRLGLL